MPEINRIPLRMDCGGIHLTSPIDRMPKGKFPYLFNARVLEEGRIDGRPGYTQVIRLADIPNSIRRLNDPANLYAPTGYILVGGGGPNLYAGIESNYIVIDSGYSTEPLFLIAFRPEGSPESWMYVYDINKLIKVRPDGVIRSIGLQPPTTCPNIDYGIPALAVITEAFSVTSWTGNSATIGSTSDRTGGSSPAITFILYNSGTTGWCCINPSGSSYWAGERMQVILNSGGGNQETVLVREVHPAIATASVAQIQYDSPTNVGACSLVIFGLPAGLDRNSLIQIGSEVVRVHEVILSPDGTQYSVRCVTTGTHVSGETITGLVSWYVYTIQTHAAAESITVTYVPVTPSSSTGTSSAQLIAAVDASTANNRPIDPANDYLHLSMLLETPNNITSVNIVIDIDDGSFTRNYWTFTVPQISLIVDGVDPGGNTWVEIVVPISSGVRTGGDNTKSFATIAGVQVGLTITGTCTYGFDCLYFFGTYGQVVQPNAPNGTAYQYRYRDSSTNVASVPGPLTRYQLNPLRESVIITPTPTTQAGVDTCDIYRIGGTIDSPLYTVSCPNAVGASVTDGLPDTPVLETDQPPDLTVIQPWPLLLPPITGTCKTVGTSVLIESSSSPIPPNLIGDTAIIINGTAYLTYGQPRSPSYLEITLDAGFQDGVTFEIGSPTTAGQPLPVAFGPLEGPFAPVVFALGDLNNAGTLYFSNLSDADSANTTNTLELCPSSEPLVSGEVWSGMAFAGSRQNMYCVRYSYLTQIGASNNTTYQQFRINTPSGIWSKWAICRTPIGIAYLGRDGIYITTDTKGDNISDEDLYPLFPHDGSPALSVVWGNDSSIILPVDMALLDKLRLTYCDEAIRFAYVDVGGNENTLIFEIYKNRWFLNNYADAINLHYMVEQEVNQPNTQQLLMMSLSAKAFMLAGGDTDNGRDITTLVLTPSADGGDERAQKLYVDTMTQADGNGTIEMVASYDNALTFSPVVNFSCTGYIEQFLENIASLANLALYRNIGAKFAWTGGPTGPRLYAWEPSGYIQPYLSTFFVTQYIVFSFPGWKHIRRMYPAYISNTPILMTIKTQDGRTFGPYTLPSSNGQFRIFPQLVGHGLKDLAFALQLDGQGQPFALFLSDFTVEAKEWSEDSYIQLAVFKS